MVKIHIFRKLFLIAVKILLSFSQGSVWGEIWATATPLFAHIVLCDTCDMLCLMSLQEQLELPEVPSEPLPEKIPGMFSLHSSGFPCCCPLQWSETLSQWECLGKWEGAAAAGLGQAQLSPLRSSRTQSFTLCSVWSFLWGADVTSAVLVTSFSCSGAASCPETPHSMGRLHEEFPPWLSQARLPPTAPGGPRRRSAGTGALRMLEPPCTALELPEAWDGLELFPPRSPVIWNQLDEDPCSPTAPGLSEHELHPGVVLSDPKPRWMDSCGDEAGKWESSLRRGPNRPWWPCLARKEPTGVHQVSVLRS